MKKIIPIGILILMISLVGCQEAIIEEEPCYGTCQCKETCNVINGSFLKYETSHWGTPSECSCYVNEEIIVI